MSKRKDTQDAASVQLDKEPVTSPVPKIIWYDHEKLPEPMRSASIMIGSKASTTRGFVKFAIEWLSQRGKEFGLTRASSGSPWVVSLAGSKLSSENKLAVSLAQAIVALANQERPP